MCWLVRPLLTCRVMNAALAFPTPHASKFAIHAEAARRAVPCFDDDSGITKLPVFDDETVVSPFALDLDDTNDGEVSMSTIVSLSSPLAERSRREVLRIDALAGEPAFSAFLVGRAAGLAVLEVCTVPTIRVAVATLSADQYALLDVQVDRDGVLNAWIDGKLAFQTRVQPLSPNAAG